MSDVSSACVAQSRSISLGPAALESCWLHAAPRRRYTNISRETGRAKAHYRSNRGTRHVLPWFARRGRGRHGDAAAAALWAFLELFLCRVVWVVSLCVWSRVGGRQTFLVCLRVFNVLPTVARNRVRTRECTCAICNVGSSINVCIYIVAVLAYHSLNRPLTWVDGPDRLEPSRGGV